MQSKYYVTGVSGTGKSTLAIELAKRGYKCIDIDDADICHWQNRKTKEDADYHAGIGREWLELHEWICNPQLLEKLLLQNDGIVFVMGMPDNDYDIIPLFEKVFLLQCPESIFLQRLNTRTNNDFASDRSEQEEMLSWYKKFESETIRLGAISINTDRSIDRVAWEIIRRIT